MTPSAICDSLVPSHTIRPQPVRLSPGSMPMIRTLDMTIGRGIAPFAKDHICAEVSRADFSSSRGGELLHHFVGDFEIGEDVLDVIVLIERVDELHQRLRRLF